MLLLTERAFAHGTRLPACRWHAALLYLSARQSSEIDTLLQFEHFQTTTQIGLH